MIAVVEYKSIKGITKFPLRERTGYHLSRRGRSLYMPEWKVWRILLNLTFLILIKKSFGQAEKCVWLIID